MEIRYKGLHYDLPTHVTERAQKRLEGLRKYLRKDGQMASAYVELGRETPAHQNGRVWKALINFNYDGNVFRAEALEETIENAIDRATDELGKELRRSKKRGESLLRKGGAMLKLLSQRAQA